MGAFTEEVLAVVDIAVLIFGRGRRIKGRYPEHLARSLRIVARDDGRVQVIEVAVVVVFVGREGQRVPQAEDGAEGVRPHPELSVLAQELHRLALGLEWVSAQVGGTVNRDFFGDYLNGLACALAFDQFAGYANTGVEADGADGLLVKVLPVHDHLQRFGAGAVVEYHEPVAAPGADPAHYGYFFAYRWRL